MSAIGFALSMAGDEVLEVSAGRGGATWGLNSRDVWVTG